MSGATLLAWVMSALALVVVLLELYVLATAERHRALVQRWARFIRTATGQSAQGIARSAIPMSLLAVLILGAVLAATPTAAAQPSEEISGAGSDGTVVAIYVVTGAIVLMGLLVLVVTRTGRPRWLVLAPCRGMDEDETAEWLGLR